MAVWQKIKENTWVRKMRCFDKIQFWILLFLFNLGTVECTQKGTAKKYTFWSCQWAGLNNPTVRLFLDILGLKIWVFFYTSLLLYINFYLPPKKIPYKVQFGKFITVKKNFMRSSIFVCVYEYFLHWIISLPKRPFMASLLQENLQEQ